MKTKLLFLCLALLGGVSSVKADVTYVEPGTYTFTGINAYGVSWGVGNSTLFESGNDATPFFTATIDGTETKFLSAKSFTDSGNNTIDWSGVLAASSDGNVYISSSSGKSGLGVNNQKTGYLLIKNLKAGDVLAVKIGYWYGNYYLAGYGQTGVASIDGVTADNVELGVDSKNNNTATKTITSDGHVIIKIVATSNNINAIGSITITRAGVETVSDPSASISSYDSRTITVTPGTSTDETATVTTYYSTTASVFTKENKTTAWTALGEGNTVTFNYPDDHGKTYRFVSESSKGAVSAICTMEALSLYKEVTISDDLYATYSFDNNLDFSNIDKFAAYIASGAATGGAITLTKVAKVQGNQWQSAVLLHATEQGTYRIPVVDSGTSYGKSNTGSSSNYFIATLWNNSTAGYNGSTVSATANNHTNYILGKNISGVVGFYKSNGNAISRNKAYLHLPDEYVPTEDGARLTLTFDDDVATAISSIARNSDKDGKILDLQGRRVDNPGKGIYIVSGKKMILK